MDPGQHSEREGTHKDGISESPMKLFKRIFFLFLEN